jgi:serine/threonine protein kinase
VQRGPDTRADVESLLAAHTASGSFAEHTPLQAFAESENTAPDDVAAGAWRLQPGDRLGPYQIEAPLGSGGMGEVYKAIDTRLNRAVALKILPDIFHGDPRVEQRFEHEASDCRPPPSAHLRAA